jgi:hypothetical protein
MTRVEVAALLNKPGLEAALPQRWCKDYRALANRNVKIEDLAEKYKISALAMETQVETWESEIIAKMCQLFPKFKPQGTELRAGSDAEAESETAQDAEITKTGGKSIGGRIVSRGHKSTPGKIFQNERLDTFRRSGRLYQTETHRPYNEDRTGGRVSEEDRYDEESGA